MPHLTLKNIGPIQLANIQLQGLTILTGASDTGKTTLAKALYCTFAVQEKPYPAALQAFQEAMQQLYTLEQEYGLHEEAIILADIAPKIYLSFYQRAIAQAVKTIQELKIEQQGTIRRGDAQRLVRSCNILHHLNAVDYVAIVVEQFKTKQLVAPKELLVGKAAHDSLIEQLFQKGYVRQQAEEIGALLDLYQGNAASVYQRVKSTNTTQLVFKETIFSNVLLLETAAVLTILAHPSALSTAPIYTQALLEPLLNNTITALDSPIYNGLEHILAGRFLVKNQQLYFQSNHQTLLPWTQLSPILQQIGLLQLLAAQGLLNVTSLLILEEPILTGDNQLYLEALLFLLESGVHLLVTTKHPTVVAQLIPCGNVLKAPTSMIIYKGKKGKKGSIFEEQSY